MSSTNAIVINGNFNVNFNDKSKSKSKSNGNFNNIWFNNIWYNIPDDGLYMFILYLMWSNILNIFMLLLCNIYNMLTFVCYIIFVQVKKLFNVEIMWYANKIHIIHIDSIYAKNELLSYEIPTLHMCLMFNQMPNFICRSLLLYESSYSFKNIALPDEIKIYIVMNMLCATREILIKSNDMYNMIVKRYPNFYKGLTISEAQEIDDYYYHVSGCYWRSAFNFPKEGELIEDTEDGKTWAINVGILTFDMTNTDPYVL